MAPVEGLVLAGEEAEARLVPSDLGLVRHLIIRRLAQLLAAGVGETLAHPKQQHHREAHGEERNEDRGGAEALRLRRASDRAVGTQRFHAVAEALAEQRRHEEVVERRIAEHEDDHPELGRLVEDCAPLLLADTAEAKREQEER